MTGSANLEAALAARGWRSGLPEDSALPWALTPMAPIAAVREWTQRHADGSLQDLLWFCTQLGWRFEPVLGPLFRDQFEAIVARHGGAHQWAALVVHLSEDRQSVAGVRWAGGGVAWDPPRYLEIPESGFTDSAWVLLFTQPGMRGPADGSTR